MSSLTFFDLLIVALLAGGVFVGFTQGLIRYALNCVVVLVSFVLASVLAGPLYDLLGFWRAWNPDLRQEVVYLVLYLGLVIAGWFIVRALYQRQRLPIYRQLDELGGAFLGLVWVALVIVFLFVVLQAFFTNAPDSAVAEASLLEDWLYIPLLNSPLVDVFRTIFLPTLGVVLGPLVPSGIADLLVAP